MAEAWVATYGDDPVIIGIATTEDGARRICYEHRHPRGGKDMLRWGQHDTAEGRYGSFYMVECYPLRVAPAEPWTEIADVLREVVDHAKVHEQFPHWREGMVMRRAEELLARLEPAPAETQAVTDGEGEPVQVLRVCPECHAVAEFDAHPDDVPETCPGCDGRWMTFTAPGAPPMQRAVTDGVAGGEESDG